MVKTCNVSSVSTLDKLSTMAIDVLRSSNYFHYRSVILDNLGWLISPLIIYLVINFLVKQWKYVKCINRIPGVPSFSPLGNVGIVLTGMKQGLEAGEALFQCMIGFGRLEEFRKSGLSRVWLGPMPAVVLSSPEAVEVLLSSNKLIDKAMFYDYMHTWLGTGLLTSRGLKWRSHRKMLTPSFHFRILEDFVPVMRKETQIFVRVLENIRASNAQGMVSDIAKPILMCALDTICETAMGSKVNAQSEPDNKYVKNVHEAGLAFMDRLMNPLLLSEHIYSVTLQGRRYKNQLAVLHEFTNAAIRGKKEQMMKEMANGTFEEKKCMVFMDTLIYQHLKDPKSLTMENIREEVDTFMFEGHDTTAWAVTWCTYLIGLDELVQEKLHQELDSAFDGDKDGNFTMEQLRGLTYTECCVKEALRLFPSVPLIGRQTALDTDFCGYMVPAGTTVGVFPYIIHRHETHWPKPEVYDPERFLPEASRYRHPFAYVPFSAGPRNCVGMKFALLEAKAMVASIFRTFKVTSLLPRDKVRISPSMILRSQLPIPAKLERR